MLSPTHLIADLDRWTCLEAIKTRGKRKSVYVKYADLVVVKMIIRAIDG